MKIFVPEQLDAYDKFWMSVTDQEGFLEARYYKGIAESEAKGVQKEKMENARKMKDLNVNIGIISQVTGLSAEEIDSL